MTARRAPGTLSAAWLVARKDLAIEFRTRTAFLSALVFSVLALCIFYFAWDETLVAPSNLAPGVLWVVLTFSALLGLQRSFAIEEHDRGIDALLVSPVSRESIYLGKAIGNLLFMCGVQAITIPALALFYNVPASRPLGIVALVVVLAMIGIVAVGTLFSAMAVNTRLAELLLPMLALPFFVPILMDAAQITTRVLGGRPLSESWPWLKILIAFDVVFAVACTLAFPYTLEE
ncbi:MAG TPA: heme exporter protein CcmB [Gemmatimonadaceae bacterium]|jgi:heme exporter protein B|nr:heme exporter protein CcmB [Gemmatimonadaceae bacterium]